jgi:hypothetical protein
MREEAKYVFVSSTPLETARVRLSVIRATEDAWLMERLIVITQPLVDNGLLSRWIDFPLRPRMRVKRRVLKACKTSTGHIVVSFITPNCLNYKLPAPYEEALFSNRVIIVREPEPVPVPVLLPVLLQDALWEEVDPYRYLKLLPLDGKPILKTLQPTHNSLIDERLFELDSGLVQVARHIAQVARELGGTSRVDSEYKESDTSSPQVFLSYARHDHDLRTLRKNIIVTPETMDCDVSHFRPGNRNLSSMRSHQGEHSTVFPRPLLLAAKVSNRSRIPQGVTPIHWRAQARKQVKPLRIGLPSNPTLEIAA